MFKLDPRLEYDTFFIGDFTLSRVLLMNDARYPWVILVPRVAGLTETYQLDDVQQHQLMLESNFVAKTLGDLVQADKVNTATLGNIVSQLHIHHVARYHSDQTWPAPVWGAGKAIPYSEEESTAVCQQLTASFSSLCHHAD